jgi:predicted transcriptional regulator
MKELTMSKLLIDDYPLVFLPTLAVKYGLNDAIVIQQIHYWSQKNKLSEDGFTWVYNTIPEWQKQFPFWSEKTIFNILKRLKEAGVLFAEKKDKNPLNHTLYYRLDYEKFENAISQDLPDRTSKVYDNTINTETTKNYSESFENFWKLYPRKIAKGNAEKAWEKINPDEKLVADIVAAIAKQKPTWTDPKFIPHPATWLNGKRWLDGVEVTTGKQLKYWEKGYTP